MSKVLVQLEEQVPELRDGGERLHDRADVAGVTLSRSAGVHQQHTIPHTHAQHVCVGPLRLRGD